jgi:peptidoglycan/xylan/chitin deacetylase (PgdA/CDA1 family)
MLKSIIRYAAGAPRMMLGLERPVVLMYHRVWEPPTDPFQIAVSPDRFAKQIAMLVAERDVVPLSWLMDKLAGGSYPLGTVAVTFDDGYHDVLRLARPILEGLNCPATVFLPTAAIETGKGFWWDVLSRIILEAPSLPELLVFRLGRVRHELRVPSDAAHEGTASAAGRRILHTTLYTMLRPAANEARADAIEELAQCVGEDPTPLEEDRPMTSEEVRELTRDDLIEIGAHTVSHPALSSLSEQAQWMEIKESRGRCEDIVGRPVTGFAYPYGDYDANSVDAVQRAGLAYACSTHCRPVARTTHPLAVPRLLAADWDEGGFRREVMARV